MSSVIETSGLTKTYGKDRGIKDVDLTVREGEVFGFLGPNGAGKTTTVRTLLGFMKPTAGEAEVFGLDIRKNSVAIRSMVGNLPGEFALEDRMTGDHLLKFFARLRGVENLDHAYELAGRIGADLDRPMRRLSRGNKQKIGLVQAMFHKPPLLILDEPTGGLDPLVQEEFLKMVDEVREEGRTVFFSSHNLSEVERICDRVGIIRGGELTAIETTDDLINKSFRHVSLTFAGPLDAEEAGRFQELEGVEEFSSSGADLSFDLHGNLNQMIKLAARHELIDMRYERPSLEEIFFAYYGGEEGDAAAPVRNGAIKAGAARAGSQTAAGSRVEGASYREEPNSQNGGGAPVEAADVGGALQKAIEAIVEQTVEKVISERYEETTAKKGEKS
ncbi:MAG: ABC transporter ATP-binding protein [Rubrobacteraceae bacterium]